MARGAPASRLSHVSPDVCSGRRAVWAACGVSAGGGGGGRLCTCACALSRACASARAPAPAPARVLLHWGRLRCSVAVVSASSPSARTHLPRARFLRGGGKRGRGKRIRSSASKFPLCSTFTAAAGPGGDATARGWGGTSVAIEDGHRGTRALLTLPPRETQVQARRAPGAIRLIIEDSRVRVSRRMSDVDVSTIADYLALLISGASANAGVRSHLVVSGYSYT